MIWKLAGAVAVMPATTMLIKGTAWLADAPWGSDAAWAAVMFGGIAAYAAGAAAIFWDGHK